MLTTKVSVSERIVVYVPGDDMSCPEYERVYREKVEAMRFAAMIREEYGEAEVYGPDGELCT